MPIGVAGGIALAGTAASAGLSAAGSANQKASASSAADAQSKGYNKGIDALTKAYQRSQGYLDPYYGMGQQAQGNLNKNYGLMPPGLTRAQQKAYKKSPAYNKYGKSLAKINASAPKTALPDLSRFDISGLAGKYDPSAITAKYDPSNITQKYSNLVAQYDPSSILAKYDVTNLGDRVNVQQDPGYEFRRQQGELAQQRMASKRGTLQGGGFAKDLENYSQGLASQEYGNAYARLVGENQTGYGREIDANNTGYGRQVDAYGREIAGNEMGYGREMAGNALGYGRELEGSNIGYGRAMGENEATYGREQNDYARRFQMLGLEYEPMQNIANRGYDAAGGMSNLASSYGGNIANLFAQQGGAQAGGITGRAAANSQMLNQIGSGLSIAALYGGQGFGGGNAMAGARTPSGGRYAPDWYTNSQNRTPGYQPPPYQQWT